MKNIIQISLLAFTVFLAPCLYAAEEEAALESPSEAETLEGQSWKINLKEAEIRAFITQVADITSRSFVIDPRVKGKVTVISHSSMTQDEVYELFLSVLHVHNYAAVMTKDGLVKVVPSNTATKDTIRIDKFGTIKGEEIITRVIAVKNSPASELIPVLRPMVAQHGHLAAVPSANAIIISDHGANIEKIVSIIEKIDGAESEELEVIALKEAWVTDIVTLLENLTPVTTGKANKKSAGGSASRVRVVADERTNRLILKGEKAARTRVKNLVAKLDVAAEQSSGTTKVIYLRYADAKKVAEILSSLVGKTSSSSRSRTGSSKGKKASATAREPTYIQADETLNALVVKADPASMDEVRDIVRQLDVKRAQVLIEAAIVEVKGDIGKALGIQWGFGDTGSAPVGGVSYSNLGNSLNDLGSAALAASDDSGASALLGGVPSLADGLSLVGGKSNSDGDFAFGAFLQAITTTSNTNILSTPSIVVLDNEEAEIIVGQEVPITTGSSQTGSGGLSNPFTTTERKDVGLTLNVIPHIHEGDLIRLEIDQQSSALSTSATDVEAGANTITTKRSIKTTILAEDQEFIVLGGLVQEDESEKVSKVPFLGDIPFLGVLFRSTKVNREKKNLMVFLKPTIMRDSKGVQALSQSKYQGVRELQLEIDDRNGAISIHRKSAFPKDLSNVWKTYPNLDGEGPSLFDEVKARVKPNENDKEEEEQKQKEEPDSPELQQDKSDEKEVSAAGANNDNELGAESNPNMSVEDPAIGSSTEPSAVDKH